MSSYQDSKEERYNVDNGPCVAHKPCA
jgi:hypothetical protein